MFRLLVPLTLICYLTGCATHIDPSRPISRDLPLSYIDLAEIKAGSEDHKKVLENYKFYNQPELTQYVTSIGYRLASVSERPHLPYQFFILDDNRVDMFSVGGGYIYVTKGLLEFVDSEAELAAVLAHEIAHVATGAHTPKVEQRPTKTQMFMRAMTMGAGAAAGVASGFVSGPAGKIASKSTDGIMKEVIPEIRKQFKKSDELEADRRAVLYLREANYDPRELLRFLDKLSKIRILGIEQYINFLNAHPPYEERREVLKEMLGGIDFKDHSFTLRNERFVSIRMMTMHFDNVRTGATSEKIVQAASVDPKPVS